MEAIIGVTEAAKRLGVTGETVREWARRGRLPATKVGKSWLFSVAEVDRRLAEAQSRGPTNNDHEIAAFVREHIGTIEVALLVLSNLDANSEIYSTLDRTHIPDLGRIAEVASELRRIVNVRAD